jgi:septal ring factor EnvC (AmiA/AmiB activator)
MRLGQGQSRTFIAGIFGKTASGGIQMFINNQGQLGTVVSSARYKRDIQAMGERSQGLHQLRPVTFRYKQDPQGQRQYGLIAEEVAKVYPELVVRGSDGKVDAVQYHELIPMLLNEVQHQQQEIAELKTENQSLRATQAQQLTAQAQQLTELKAQNEEQRAQNVALAARLERLEAGAVRAATAAPR